MEFVSMRDFTSSPRELRKKLTNNKELVITNNGTPSMLVIDIANRNFIKLVDYLHRQEALDILHDIQIASVRSGTDNMSFDEIDAEIKAHRQEKRSKWQR